MDIKKIYADFEAALAVHDLETVCKIFVQTMEYGNALAQAGKRKEIPPEADKIISYVNVMLYHVMKLLSDGDFEAAKFYLFAPRKAQMNFNANYLHLYYLTGRAFYGTNDFIRAIKFFTEYENLRTKHFSDVDEVGLFFHANCLALTGNFSAAAGLYEKILRIKANFPEAKKNLEAVRRGSTEIVRELFSLWNFPNWRDVPIFINARDRLGVMKKLIDWLLAAGYRKLIILDNRSTYPPLLEYYSALESDWRVKVIRLEKNFGFKAIWLSGVLERLKIATPYVYTDPDVLPIERCPKDFVKRLMKILDGNHEIRKVGPGLVYDDITFFNADACKDQEKFFYESTQVGDELYYVQIDTTFALYSNTRHYSLRFSLRTLGDLMTYHLPWYFDYDNLPDDEKYYMEHTDKSSSVAMYFKNFQQQRERQEFSVGSYVHNS